MGEPSKVCLFLISIYNLHFIPPSIDQQKTLKAKPVKEPTFLRPGEYAVLAKMFQCFSRMNPYNKAGLWFPFGFPIWP